MTTQIETLRHQSAGPVTDRTQVQQNLHEIVAPLVQAVPFRAIEALQSQIVALAERIEARRMSGIDSSLLTPIEDGLNEVRTVLQQLKPQESLAAFQGALQDLTERLSRGRGSHPVSPKPQIDAVIASLDNVAALVSSTETLTALSDEVRGLTARCERIVAPSARPATPKPAQPAADTLPLSIERTLKDINLRLDALQKGAPPRDALPPEAGVVSADGSAQDALAAAHATLSELVGRLETNLRASRDPRAASSRPESAIDHPSLPVAIHRSPTGFRDVAQEHDSDFRKTGRHHQPPYAEFTGDTDPDIQRRSIVIPIRPLIFSVMVIVLAAVAARVSMQMTDVSLPAIMKADALQAADTKDIVTGTIPAAAEPHVPDLARSQSPDTPAQERQVQQSELAVGEFENTGVIGRPVPVAAGTRDAAAREPSLPLPESLPSLLRAEAAKGKAAAEYEVGVRLVEGKSAPVNTEEGLRWLRRAAKSGIIPAHLWIGSLYEKGQGVEKDLTMARTHYLVAAEKGNAKAMHNLAVLYAEGIDGRRDYKTAARWFQRASERGIADSQYNLAVLLMRGIGIDQNHYEAYKWFALAALQGDREAARHRDDIGNKLEPGLLAKAKAAVQSFTPQTQPNEAVVVTTPPGGWDRTSGETGAGRKSRSGVLARGAS